MKKKKINFMCVKCGELYPSVEEAQQCCDFEPTEEDYNGKR
jgi:hypothetical protein